MRGGGLMRAAEAATGRPLLICCWPLVALLGSSVRKSTPSALINRQMGFQVL